uniref:Signal peptide protein n=1 Tax=Heterorhabditis bacteriophora TaxID=37862 RepID=A0A1I7WGK2_HETBA
MLSMKLYSCSQNSDVIFLYIFDTQKQIEKMVGIRRHMHVCKPKVIKRTPFEMPKKIGEGDIQKIVQIDIDGVHHSQLDISCPWKPATNDGFLRLLAITVPKILETRRNLKCHKICLSDTNIYYNKYKANIRWFTVIVSLIRNDDNLFICFQLNQNFHKRNIYKFYKFQTSKRITWTVDANVLNGKGTSPVLHANLTTILIGSCEKSLCHAKHRHYCLCLCDIKTNSQHKEGLVEHSEFSKLNIYRFSIFAYITKPKYDRLYNKTIISTLLYNLQSLAIFGILYEINFSPPSYLCNQLESISKNVVCRLYLHNFQLFIVYLRLFLMSWLSFELRKSLLILAQHPKGQRVRTERTVVPFDFSVFQPYYHHSRFVKIRMYFLVGDCARILSLLKLVMAFVSFQCRSLCLRQISAHYEVLVTHCDSSISLFWNTLTAPFGIDLADIEGVHRFY